MSPVWGVLGRPCGGQGTPGHGGDAVPTVSPPGRTQRDAPTLRRCRELGGTPRTPTPSRGRVTGCGSAGEPLRKGGPPAGPPPDPLGWFGVLVPPTLRQAQGSFQRGVTLAVEVAELQATVEAAAARYRQLLRQKRHPAGDSGDSQSPTGTPGDSKDTEGDTVTPVTA
ncbi:hypothetical protein DV515_00018199 [Chloebia gouldiae]|uniref:Vacuolar ATPase assembly protein VMA22 n=1 Tax=Chloebia gouldiae TaxID=44316 RepID=A0A3L8Q879_CHLGU|nr:hypothetical protein DV515_00018199 [Chloebia gouldiae]